MGLSCYCDWAVTDMHPYDLCLASMDVDNYFG